MTRTTYSTPPVSALRAVALATLVVTAGCASPDPAHAPRWRMEPAMSVIHSQAPGQAYYQMGNYEAGMLRWDRAIDAYRKAIAAEPLNVEAHNALGVALAQATRYEEAETVLRHAAALAPYAAHIMSNLGNTLLLAGKPQEAVAELQAALRLDASNKVALDNLRRARALTEPAPARSAEARAVETSAVSGLRVVDQPTIGAMGRGEALPPATRSAVELPAAAIQADRSAALPAYRLQILNGNGITGVAARMRELLLERGVPAARVANLPPFRVAVTRVEYQPGYAEQARELSRRLPTPSALVSVPASRAMADVRVVIGHDIKYAAACAALRACQPVTGVAAAGVVLPSAGAR